MKSVSDVIHEYLYRRRLKRAIAGYRRAIEELGLAGISVRVIGETLVFVGDLCRKIGDGRGAREAYLEAVEIFLNGDREQLSSYEAHAWLGLAVVAVHECNDELAQRYFHLGFNAVEEFYDEEDAGFLFAEFVKERALVYQRLQQRERAVNHGQG